MSFERSMSICVRCGVALLLGVVFGGCARNAPPRPVCDAPPGLPAVTFPDPVSAEEEKAYPAREMTGDPPASGLRYWRVPLHRVPAHGCYVSAIRRDTADGPVWELWENTWGDDASTRTLRVLRVPRLADIGGPDGEKEIVVTGEAVDDVYVPAGPGKLAPKEPPELSPLRGYTRPHVVLDDEYGYVALVCVCPDYRPGSVSLMPAILTSPTGKAGTWTYRGMLTGEPLAEQKKQGRPVWSDGGSIFRMPDGSWRIYLNNFGGAAISLLTSETLDGPWSFHRDEDGSILDLLPPGEDGKPRPNCFPHVLRVSETEWHLWYSDRWPVMSIRHFSSRDGLTWRAYGEQPEITRAVVNGRGIKCLRTCLSPDGTTIFGFLSVWELEERNREKGWQLYLLRLPVGLQP